VSKLREREGSVSDSPADAIGAVVKRLARPHDSGGTVIERSVIIAESDSAAILTWISDHRGVADSSAAASAGRSTGLHGARVDGAISSQEGPPRRFVLPRDAFDD
jgi:hypothetical protein